MVFSSPTFLLLFLPCVLALYYLFPGKLVFRKYWMVVRNVLLLLASLFFYAWGEQEYVLLMLVSIGVNHFFAQFITRFSVLVIGVSFNLLLLCFFKYAYFLLSNINSLMQGLGVLSLPVIDPHLPLGISFFTFQSISYLVDIYRKAAPSQKNPLYTALYISLFPQLIAGPIVRYQHVALQLIERTTTLKNFEYGVKRFVFGLSKKVIIANGIAGFVDYAFQLPPENLTTSLAWLATFGYGLQIYFDFSGYSDMAIGLGAMFGFSFPENFKYPYIASSIRDFWHRWHITLSEWFRDYLYIPLGGSRVGTTLTYINLLIVFTLCGLWHGASWMFLFWGLYHGFFLVLERGVFGQWIDKQKSFVQSLYALVVVMCGWVFFRAETLDQVTLFFTRMIGFNDGATTNGALALFLRGDLYLLVIVAIFSATPLVSKLYERLERYVLLRSIVLATLLIASISKLATSSYDPFIYFRF